MIHPHTDSMPSSTRPQRSKAVLGRLLVFLQLVALTLTALPARADKPAAKADLSTNYIGEIERGEAQATLDSLFAIMDALEINPSLLFTPLDRPQDKEEILKRTRELLDLLADCK